ncbi:hypothetical protein H6G00_01505 [Leptolyngbya sp. FACHB-541]|uniref:hypothetical protein n=1 Tax=Leptolyngbya sp. FACHB-541 TaxID=2692810 RepID=UPI0016870AA7|nr:hypothetical protein [Leptolyngbya sp. FACHB-541]MBD1995306.1 hypothetical protein [Leptolyngbya sp. FACHB-541]
MIAAATPLQQPNPQTQPNGQALPPMKAIALTLKQIIEEAFTSGISRVLTFDVDQQNGVNGKFHANEQVYDFAISSEGKLRYNEVEATSASRSDSILNGFYLDSGKLRNGRIDAAPAGKRTCGAGKPCGKSCIERGDECQIALSPMSMVKFQKLRRAIIQVKANRISMAQSAKATETKANQPSQKAAEAPPKAAKAEASPKPAKEETTKEETTKKEGSGAVGNLAAGLVGGIAGAAAFAAIGAQIRQGQDMPLKPQDKQALDEVPTGAKVAVVAGATLVGTPVAAYVVARAQYRNGFKESAELAKKMAEDPNEVWVDKKLDKRGKEQMTFVVGGFGGEEGKNSQRWGDQFASGRKPGRGSDGLFDNHHVTPIDNKEFDVDAKAVAERLANGDPITKAAEQYGLLALEIPTRLMLDTVFKEKRNPVAVRAAANAWAYHQKYPDKPINLVGFSGGGMATHEAAEILKEMGAKNVRVANLGSPYWGLTEKVGDSITIGSANDDRIENVILRDRVEVETVTDHYGYFLDPNVRNTLKDFFSGKTVSSYQATDKEKEKARKLAERKKNMFLRTMDKTSKADTAETPSRTNRKSKPGFDWVADPSVEGNGYWRKERKGLNGIRSAVVTKAKALTSRTSLSTKTQAFLGVDERERKYRITDNAVLSAAATAYTKINEYEQLDQKIDGLPVNPDLKQKIKSMTGAAKVYLAQQIFRKQGASLISVDERQNFSTFGKPDGSLMSVGSVGSKVITFGSQSVGAAGGFPIYEMGFMVNNSYDRKPGDVKEGLKLVKIAKSAYREHITNLPENTFLRAEPWKKDGAGEQRQSIYEKEGFRSLPMRGGYLWALKNQGEFARIPNEQADYIASLIQGNRADSAKTLSKAAKKTKPGFDWVTDPSVENGGYWRKQRKGGKVGIQASSGGSLAAFAGAAILGGAIAAKAISDENSKVDRNKSQGIPPLAKTAALATAAAIGISGGRYLALREKYRANFQESAEMALEQSKKIEPSSVKERQHTIVLGVGGMGYEEDSAAVRSGDRIANSFRMAFSKDGGKDLKTIAISNAESNIPANKSKPEDEFDRAVDALKVLGTNLTKGRNDTAVELASQAIAYARKYPDRQIVLAGHSLGGQVVNEAQEILKLAYPEIKPRLKSLSFGSFWGGLTEPFGESYMIQGSKDETINKYPGRQDAKLFDDIDGHTQEKYFRDPQVNAFVKDLIYRDVPAAPPKQASQKKPKQKSPNSNGKSQGQKSQGQKTQSQATKTDAYLEGRALARRDAESTPKRQAAALVKQAIASVYPDIQGLPTLQLAPSDAIIGRFRGSDGAILDYRISAQGAIQYKELVRQDVAADRCLKGTQCGEACVERGSECDRPLGARAKQQVAKAKDFLRQLQSEVQSVTKTGRGREFDIKPVIEELAVMGAGAAPPWAAPVASGAARVAMRTWRLSYEDISRSGLNGYVEGVKNMTTEQKQQLVSDTFVEVAAGAVGTAAGTAASSNFSGFHTPAIFGAELNLAGIGAGASSGMTTAKVVEPVSKRLSQRLVK